MLIWISIGLYNKMNINRAGNSNWGIKFFKNFPIPKIGEELKAKQTCITKHNI